MSYHQDPPNDMLFRYMSACWQNIGNVGLTLGKNVVPTCQTTRQDDIIQDCDNMSADSFWHKEKTAKLHRKLHRNGMIWCEKVAKMLSYALIHIYVSFLS